MKRLLLRNGYGWPPAILGLLADGLSKAWITEHFYLHESRPIIANVFYFTYVRNPGAAFGFFEGPWLKWLSLAASLGLIALLLWGPRLSVGEQVGLGFILSGAMGNGIDRFFLGEVVDFLHLPIIPFINFPIFNVADVSINLGIICLLIVAWGETDSAP
ncbi:lipoprotein signal peptidase [Geitlerinema sp. P-1104]|uniref:signal peptidase II n=1 Tax=Geitlerinema sp. P-1104 TaxID=2546230 RepID=UPI0014774AF3|nr:signal peptidase II [Geitlerinema sp. P-1104]NMG57777.1 lipoprotein signal peptidase [Geitlerinema sp. P-1104]